MSFYIGLAVGIPLGAVLLLAITSAAIYFTLRRPWPLVAIALTLITAPAFAGHPCRVVQQQVVQPVYYPQQISYFVGAPVRVEAIVQKTLRDDPEYAELQKFKAWKSLASGQTVAPEAPDGSPALTIKTRCASCHSGPNAKGGVTLDGTQAVDDATFRAFSRMYLTGADVPKAMQPLMAKLTADEGSAVLAELLKLEKPAPTAADEEPGTLK
jgi:hypothetical protein